MTANVEIVEGADDVAIAAWLHTRLKRALAASEAPVAVTVPGGSTPFPILQRLAAMTAPEPMGQGFSG